MKKMIFGIGIVLAVLVVFTASAVADSVLYFVPENSSADPGDNTIVLLMLNTTQSDIRGVQCHIRFDYNVVNVTNAEEGTFDWDMWDWAHKEHEGEKYLFIGGMKFGGCGPGELQVGKLTLTGINPGITPIEFANQYNGTGTKPWDPTMITNTGNVPQDFTAINGAFTYAGPEETYTKDLVPGWNLISLPLTNMTDMTIANVIDTSLSGKYDALYKYDAATHSFEALSGSDEMENGVGYFINMTAADTWSYKGTAYDSIEVELSQGLNCVGWTNTSANLPGALNSIAGKYNYVARWNASEQKYEVYEPNAPPVFNDFGTMDRGEGYWIAAKEACTLS